MTIAEATLINKHQTLEYMGIASALGIILVVIGHSLPPHLAYPVDDQFANTAYGIIEFIYTFHMPLFFTISGFLYVHTNPPTMNMRYETLVKNKAIRLLLPYIVLGTIAFLPKLFLAQFAKNPIEPTADFYLNTILYPWNNSIRFFWFLPTLFLIFLAAPILLGIMNIKSVILSRFYKVTLLVGLVFLNIEFEHNAQPATIFNYSGALHNLIYFWFGMWMYPVVIKLIYKEALKPGLLSMIISIVTISTSIVIYISFYSAATLVGLINAIFGIVAVLVFSLAIMNFNPIFLKWIDRYSYQIYLTSFFFQVPIQIVLYYVLKTGSSTVLVASFIVGLLGPLFFVFTFKRLKLPGKILIGL